MNWLQHLWNHGVPSHLTVLPVVDDRGHLAVGLPPTTSSVGISGSYRCVLEDVHPGMFLLFHMMPVACVAVPVHHRVSPDLGELSSDVVSFGRQDFVMTLSLQYSVLTR